MGTVTNICALLLFVGACTAAPQYPDQSADVVQPQPQCRSHQGCVPYFQCVDGYINTDGAGLLDLRIKPKPSTQQNDVPCTEADYPDVPALCCTIPGRVPETPDTPTIRYVECPAGSSCIAESSCQIGGTIQDVSGTMVPYASGGSWSSCVRDGSSTSEVGGVGVCCAKPPPPKIVTCPTTKVCVSNHQCDASGNVVTDGSGGQLDLRIVTNAKCYVQVSTAAGGYGDQTTEVGVCCNPPKIPLPKLQVCPLKSICMYEYLCEDRIIDNAGSLVSYAEGGSWSRCDIDGNPSTPGVCCLNPITYPVATQCGVRKPVVDQRIKSNIAFNEAEFGEFPWQAIIFFSNYTFKCGASLIGDRWLLTAAHCVNGNSGSDFKVRLGEWQVNTFDEALPYLDVDVATVTIHPQFNPKNVQNDIAVMELTKPLDYQYHINTICLPNPGQTFWGERCIATGWGKDSFEGQYQHILKKVDLPTVDKQQCQSLLQKTRLGKWYQLDNSFMCAGGEENKDACKGDGGGPLACRDPTTGRYVLTGLTAFGIGCGNKDVPGVYADVQVLLPFVQAVLSGSYDPNTFGKIVQNPVEVETVPGYGK